jgi:hypothetical protein
MPHQMCRECHRLVSEAANTCPHCGIPQPVPTDDPFPHLRPYASALLLGLALLWIGGLWFRYQVAQLEAVIDAPVPVASMARDPHPGFQSLPQAVWLGAPLFGRRDQAYVGRVTSLSCPRQPVGVGGVACLQIEFADGRREWVAWTTAVAGHLTPRRH